jgi:nicotinamidase-related amidase
MASLDLIVGSPALVVVDLQAGAYNTDGAVPIMDGYADVVRNSTRLIRAARTSGVPVIFLQEVHSRTGVDFGRELDGEEDVHDLEDNPGTALVPEAQAQPDEYLVKKRRYSGFFGTDLEILLKGLGSVTLVLCGCLTDVCVQYTYIDAHQHDYYARVARDAVIGSSPEAHAAALRAMEYFQTGALRTTDELVSALSQYEGVGRPPVLEASAGPDRE